MKLKIEGVSKEIKDRVVNITNKPVAFYPEESVVDIVGGNDEDIAKLTDEGISTKRVSPEE